MVALRIIRKLEMLAYNFVNKIVFSVKGVSCETHISNINGFLRIAGTGRIRIGAGTRINSGARKNPIGGDTSCWLVCRGPGEILIGKDCGLSNCSIVSDTLVDISDRVMIGGGTKIYDTDFHNIDPSERNSEKRGFHHGRTKAVVIKSDAFIGAHSIILKGVTIGRNSVVGAGSVVCRDVPDNELWAGNPAMRIRDIPSASFR